MFKLYPYYSLGFQICRASNGYSEVALTSDQIPLTLFDFVLSSVGCLRELLVQSTAYICCTDVLYMPVIISFERLGCWNPSATLKIRLSFIS